MDGGEHIGKIVLTMRLSPRPAGGGRGRCRRLRNRAAALPYISIPVSLTS